MNSNILQELKKCRNTLFCNISRYAEMKAKNPSTKTRVVGSLWVPKDEAYYVDEEGCFNIYQLDTSNEVEINNEQIDSAREEA